MNKTLTNLGLTYNGIGDAGATSIAEVIKVNKTLTNLNLYRNCMSDPDATSIAGTIANDLNRLLEEKLKGLYFFFLTFPFCERMAKLLRSFF